MTKIITWTITVLTSHGLTVIQASADLDDQLNSIIETSIVVKWTLDDILDYSIEIKEMKFTVQRDDQSIETVKDIHGEFFAYEKKPVEGIKQDGAQMLAPNRTELKKIMNKRACGFQ